MPETLLEELLDPRTLADVLILSVGVLALREHRRQKAHARSLGVSWPLGLILLGLLATSAVHGTQLALSVLAAAAPGSMGGVTIAREIPAQWGRAGAVVAVVLLGAGILVMLRRVLPTARYTLERLQMARVHLSHEVETRRRAERQLRVSQHELARRVEERTADLAESNRQLEEEIDHHKRTMREVEYRAGFEALIGRVSALLVYPARRGDTSVLSEVLRQVGDFLGLDRAAIVELDTDRARLASLVEWVREGARGSLARLDGVPRERVEHWIGRLCRAEVVLFDRSGSLEGIDEEGKRRTPSPGDAVVGGVPLMVGGRVLGCLVVDRSAGAPAWDEEALGRLRLIAELLATSIHRSRVEADLASQARNYSTIFHSASDAIFIHDAGTGEILDVNAKACEMWGWERGAMVGSDVGLLSSDAPGFDIQKALDFIRSASEEAPQLFEWPARSAHGREFWVEVNLRAAEVGERRVVLAFVRDVSERKSADQQRQKLERQLMQSQRMESLGKLAGGVAHDFNNILTVIIGNAHFARDVGRDSGPLDPVVLACLEEIECSGERAAALTQQLLAFGRRQVIKPEVMDLGDALAGMEGMLRRLIAEDIKLEIDIDPRTPPILADAGQIEQVVLNLVVNARDAMPLGGVITVESFRRRKVSEDGEEAEDFAVVVVRDTGCGIEPDCLDHIFEPFFTTKPVGKGTGLGLSTVHGIVKQLGGSIQVESEPDKGTSVEICLATSEIERRAQSTAASRPARRARGGTVLVCEDDDRVRRLTCAALSKGGFRVHEASGGAEALRVARGITEPIDALVTDVIMPEMDGRRLAEEMCRERPGIQVLFLSGYPADVLAPYGVLPDEVELLEKPFRGHELVERVAALLSR